MLSKRVALFSDKMAMFADATIPRLLAPIEVHANWIIKNIYHNPYTKDQNNAPTIARFHHGGQHVSRVAAYIPVLNNFRHKLKLSGVAEPLCDDFLKKLQLVALLHDAGRDSDGEDIYELQSAAMCFLYLRNIGLAENEALQFAELIINKDFETTFHPYDGDYTYRIIAIRNEHYLTLKEITVSGYPVSNPLFVEALILLHDADCLDIIRARTVFQAEYLFSYKHIYTKTHYWEKDAAALTLLGELIQNIKALIFNQGDGRNCTDVTTKIHYEHAENCYQLTLLDFERYRLLRSLSVSMTAPQALIPKAATTSFAKRTDGTMGEEELQCRIAHGLIYFRGVCSPSKEQKNGMSRGDIEIDYTYKSGGNQRRSAHLLPSDLFHGVGFVVAAKIADIKTLKHKDLNTGYGQKYHYMTTPEKPETLFAKRAQVQHAMLFGHNSDTEFSHNEAILNIKRFIGIGVSTSITRCIDCASDRHDNISQRAANLLQALYLQQLHEKKTGRRLPIYTYSSTENIISEICLNDDDILALWKLIIKKYLQEYHEITKLSTAFIKYASLNSSAHTHMLAEKTIPLPVDCYLSAEDNDELDQHIETLQFKTMRNKLKGEILTLLHSSSREHCVIYDSLIHLKMIYMADDLHELLTDEMSKQLQDAITNLMQANDSELIDPSRYDTSCIILAFRIAKRLNNQVLLRTLHERATNLNLDLDKSDFTCRHVSQYYLLQIAKEFKLEHYGTIKARVNGFIATDIANTRKLIASKHREASSHSSPPYNSLVSLNQPFRILHHLPNTDLSEANKTSLKQLMREHTALSIIHLSCFDKFKQDFGGFLYTSYFLDEVNTEIELQLVFMKRFDLNEPDIENLLIILIELALEKVEIFTPDILTNYFLKWAQSLNTLDEAFLSKIIHNVCPATHANVDGNTSIIAIANIQALLLAQTKNSESRKSIQQSMHSRWMSSNKFYFSTKPDIAALQYANLEKDGLLEHVPEPVLTLLMYEMVKLTTKHETLAQELVKLLQDKHQFLKEFILDGSDDGTIKKHRGLTLFDQNSPPIACSSAASSSAITAMTPLNQ